MDNINECAETIKLFDLLGVNYKHEFGSDYEYIPEDHGGCTDDIDVMLTIFDTIFCFDKKGNFIGLYNMHNYKFHRKPKQDA